MNNKRKSYKPTKKARILIKYFINSDKTQRLRMPCRVPRPLIKLEKPKSRLPPRKTDKKKKDEKKYRMVYVPHSAKKYKCFGLFQKILGPYDLENMVPLMGAALNMKYSYTNLLSARVDSFLVNSTFNKFHHSFRNPKSNKYLPKLNTYLERNIIKQAYYPHKDIKKLEIQCMKAFETYLKMHYGKDAFCSAYFFDVSEDLMNSVIMIENSIENKEEEKPKKKAAARPNLSKFKMSGMKSGNRFDPNKFGGLMQGMKAGKKMLQRSRGGGFGKKGGGLMKKGGGFKLPPRKVVKKEEPKEPEKPKEPFDWVLKSKWSSCHFLRVKTVKVRTGGMGERKNEFVEKLTISAESSVFVSMKTKGNFLEFNCFLDCGYFGKSKSMEHEKIEKVFKFYHKNQQEKNINMINALGEMVVENENRLHDKFTEVVFAKTLNQVFNEGGFFKAGDRPRDQPKVKNEIHNRVEIRKKKRTNKIK